MNTIMDKIFITVFSLFVVVLSAASVVVAKTNDLQASIEDTVSCEQTNESVSSNNQQCVMLTAEQFEKLLNAASLNAAIKNSLNKAPEKAKPFWHKIISMASQGAKLTYKCTLGLPVELRVLVYLYFIIKYKPELISWVVEQLIVTSPKAAALVAAELAKASVKLGAATTTGFFSAVLPTIPLSGIRPVVNALVPTALNSWAMSLGF